MDAENLPKKLDNRHVAYWELQPGFVYFIAAGDPPSAIKIGVSTATTMKGRLKAHQSSNHEPLYVLGLIEFLQEDKPMAEANRLELELHGRFSAARRFLSGPGNEWFTPNQDLYEYIQQYSTPPEEFGLSRCIAKLGPGLKK